MTGLIVDWRILNFYILIIPLWHSLFIITRGDTINTSACIGDDVTLPWRTDWATHATVIIYESGSTERIVYTNSEDNPTYRYNKLNINGEQMELINISSEDFGRYNIYAKPSIDNENALDLSQTPGDECQPPTPRSTYVPVYNTDRSTIGAPGCPQVMTSSLGTGWTVLLAILGTFSAGFFLLAAYVVYRCKNSSGHDYRPALPPPQETGTSPDV